jgi:hypothetical protein
MPRVRKDKKMTYAGTMVLPRNAVRMTEDEMTYVEGGAASITTLKNNLQGLAKSFAGSLVGTGLLSAATGVASRTLAVAYTYAAAIVGRAGLLIGGIIGGVIAVVGAVLAVKYLAEHRVFY